MPAHVAGLRVTRLVRHGAAPGGRQGWSVTLDGNQRIDGWLCSRGHQVELAVRDGTPAFAGCHLAAGNEIGGAAVPPGAWVAARQPARGCCAPKAATRWTWAGCRCSRWT